jgi:hypothetical protein
MKIRMSMVHKRRVEAMSKMLRGHYDVDRDEEPTHLRDAITDSLHAIRLNGMDVRTELRMALSNYCSEADDTFGDVLDVLRSRDA